MTLSIGSLFSGCGGLELGIEVAVPGSKTIWQVEKDPYALKVLSRHWPKAERFTDVKTVSSSLLEPVDIICGGFPCQDISLAGKGGGLTGERSGLWWEMYRVICEIRPRVVVVENVPALVTRGLPTVLGALSEAGYDAEWDCISASSLGAWHKRERLFVIAYSNSSGLEEQRWHGPDEEEHAAIKCGRRWTSEPSVGRVANGVPKRVDRLRLLGNAVVPQVSYRVGLRVREIIYNTGELNDG